MTMGANFEAEYSAFKSVQHDWNTVEEKAVIDSSVVQFESWLLKLILMTRV